MADSKQDMERLSHATIVPPTRTETTLARATAACHATGVDDLRELLGALGLTEDAGPRVRLADLEWRPDRHLDRSSDAPAATAPDSPEVIRSRKAAAKRRRDAARAHLAAQGLSTREIRSALARMEA